MPSRKADPRLPTAARAAAIAALRSVCGVEAVSVTVSSPEAAAVTTYTASFTGWSPSLHRTPCYAHVNADHRDPDLGETLAASFSSAIGAQRERLQAGIALGVVEPLPILIDGAEDVETSHLAIDRALVALAREHGLDPYSEILETLCGLHGADMDHDGSAVVENDNGIVAETPQGRVVGMALGIRSAHEGVEAIYDGVTLDIEGLVLPDTVLATMAGRTLGDVAQVHPALDGRTVFGAEALDGKGRPGVRIALEFDLMPLDDAKGE